ncbi:hypothetical protein K7X08_026466 [Anisodus acutangulus]|uniref:Uncharacterized protein n=1 Tax=Anisodus acutangulus TaxID=402998 RepID=A0A9Q1LLT6_9SOLA|nr:hypothetical protein K7X08_026466 [Anisodus acutangulus]
MQCHRVGDCQDTRELACQVQVGLRYSNLSKSVCASSRDLASLCPNCINFNPILNLNSNSPFVRFQVTQAQVWVLLNIITLAQLNSKAQVSKLVLHLAKKLVFFHILLYSNNIPFFIPTLI